MAKTYIVTVTAADRVGIVFSVAGALRDQGGNILELSQTVLRGYFTIILAVAFDGPRDPAALAEAIRSRGRRFNLHVVVVEAEPGADRPPVPDGERFLLTILGEDSPGSIHSLSGCLAAHGVNIVDLHARADAGRFSLIMEVFLPPDLPPDTIRAELERIGADRNLEAYVQHEAIFRATNEPRPVRLGPAPNPQGPAVVPH